MDIYYDGSNSFEELVFEGFSGGTSNGKHFVIELNGDIGIGKANPSFPIEHANGGHLTVGGSWINASDRRLKTDITPLQYGLNEIMSLRPVSYKMKADSSKQVGFIAQEVQELIPELISGIEGDLEKGETLGMSYDQLTSVIVNAMKEQQVMITNLQSENALLESKFEQVKADHSSEIVQMKNTLQEIQAMLGINDEE